MNSLLSRFRSMMTPPDGGDIAGLCRRTRALSVWEGSLWAVMWGCADSYLAPFALFLGAGSFVLAFVGSGPVLITALSQLAGVHLLDRLGRRKPIILAGIGIQSLTLMPLFLLPLLLPSGGIAALVVCVTVYFFSLGLTIPPWMSLLGDVVEPEQRGSYFSGRTRINMLMMGTALMLAGVIAHRWERAGFTAVGFGFLFGIALLARLTSMIFMKHHYEAPLVTREEDGAFSFRDFLRDPRHANYARFTFTIALMNGTANIAGPFFAVYMLRDLQWSYLLFTINMLTFLAAQTLFVRWWGAISDRHGNRAVLVATSCLLPFLPFQWVFSTNYFFLLFAQVVSGATWSGFNLATINFIYDSIPQTHRARALGYYSAINGLFSFLGAVVIGAFIAEYAPSSFTVGLIEITLTSSLPMVFVVSGLVRGIAAAIMLPQFSEVREVEPISTTRILWRLGIGQPLFGQVGEFMPRLRALFPGERKKRQQPFRRQ
jgi:MFS family permease